MRKAIVALVLVVLVVAGVVGYLWVYGGSPGTGAETSPQPSLGDCNGSGLALIKYNGETVKVEYWMHPDFRWEHGRKVWYCAVQVTFPHPINGVGGFAVPRDEFESKYLVRYLSNTGGGTPATLLETLNGEWASAGGEELTEWWNNVTEVKASEVMEYINQVWERMENSNKYYDYVFPTGDWMVPPKPQPNQTVKIYSIKLWFGARLDILAYQNPTDPSKLEVVMYGTIENWTQYTDLVSRNMIFGGVDIKENPLAPQMSAYNFTDAVWVGWKIKLDNEGGQLFTPNSTLTPEVAMLLEEPMIRENGGIGRALHALDLSFWQVVGFPSFGLASNILLPPNPSINEQVEWAKKVTWDVVLTNVKYGPGPAGETTTPVGIRYAENGMCHDQSLSTATFISDALGMYSVYMTLGVQTKLASNHAISFILVPSSVQGKMRGIPSLLDVDKDGVNDTLIVVVDTAKLSSEEILSDRISEGLFPPFSVIDPRFVNNGDIPASATHYGDANGMYWYPETLPRAFVPSWWEWVKETYPRQNYTIMTEPSKWLTPERDQDWTAAFPNGTIIKIHIKIAPCITKEEVYDDLFPFIWYHLGSEEERWMVHVPVTILLEAYKQLFQDYLPKPTIIAVKPPTQPQTLPPPPTLHDTVPQLDKWIEARVKADWNLNYHILEQHEVNCNNQP